jgi:UDP-N-acetylglucosamine 4,6-dehydratase/5-epimerase
MFKDKTLLITGGTGSFGNAVLRKVTDEGWKEIRIFSRDEKKQVDMRSRLSQNHVKFYIGDVRDYNSVCDAMIGVDYVFHAAALKQVPSCEFYPIEAVRTNILGTENVLRAAIQNEVARCVVLSTDKAVYPINAMGMSKALMEKVMVAQSRLCDPDKTVLCATRYGNVMASRGSVLPLFLAQIESGEPITVTDPAMTRFLMSLDDSVDLVLHAFANARPGDVFVQKSPAATVIDLASALIEMTGRESEIRIIGTRHGEKLAETLVSREEMSRAEDLGRYFRIQADNRDLNYHQYEDQGNPLTAELADYTSDSTNQLDVKGIIGLIKGLGYFKSDIDAVRNRDALYVPQNDLATWS